MGAEKKDDNFFDKKRKNIPFIEILNEISKICF